MASVQKRNGKYCVIYRYQDKDGKKKQKWETFDRREDALNRKKEIEYKVSTGTSASFETESEMRALIDSSLPKDSSPRSSLPYLKGLSHMEHQHDSGHPQTLKKLL